MLQRFNRNLQLGILGGGTETLRRRQSLGGETSDSRVQLAAAFEALEAKVEGAANERSRRVLQIMERLERNVSWHDVNYEL